jgi:uncharacterized protein (DUF2062 family)
MINPINLLNPLIAGAVLASEMGLLALLMVTRKEFSHRDRRRLAELAEANDAMATMRSKVDELCAESRERASFPIASGRRTSLNLHPRAEALRMLRRGNDEHTVSATLNLPLADVALLQKVSQILCAARE